VLRRSNKHNIRSDVSSVWSPKNSGGRKWDALEMKEEIEKLISKKEIRNENLVFHDDGRNDFDQRGVYGHLYGVQARRDLFPGGQLEGQI